MQIINSITEIRQAITKEKLHNIHDDTNSNITNIINSTNSVSNTNSISNTNSVSSPNSDIIKDTNKTTDNDKVIKHISFIPTMGALHDGHLSLLDSSCKYYPNALHVFSIFVNPIQFNSSSDLINYPNNLEKDIEILSNSNKVDYLFLPQAKEIYPDDFNTIISISNVSKIDNLNKSNSNSNNKSNSNNNDTRDINDPADCLCAKYRGKSHFQGVLTVIAKFYHIINFDSIILGEKDFQQYFLIKKMIKDLNINVDVIMSPTIRIKNGLAYSSRNLRLETTARNNIAPEIRKSFLKIKSKLNLAQKQNDRSQMLKSDYLTQILEQEKNYLITKGFSDVEYLEIRNQQNLHLCQKVSDIDKNSRIFCAAYLNDVRLIDNQLLIELAL